MYKDYFGLKETPFSIAPDPRYLYMSEQHREALAHLIFGFNSDGGFVLLTGEVGTGKTTVCRCLLEQVPKDSSIAFIINPKLNVEELLATICDEFGIKYPERNISIKVFVDLLNAYLLDAHAKGRKAVLIIDEAQNLSSDVLEELRLLTNLETSQCKLLQIILLGQPELREKLSKPELRQLSQRIIARYHLGPLSRKDISAYVTHRLAIAGLSNELFTSSTISKIYSLSGGVPRLINVLCDRALLGTFVRKEKKVNKTTLKKAAEEVFEKPGVIKQHKNALVLLLSVFTILIAAGFIFRPFNNNDLKQPDMYGPPKPPALDKLQWPDNTPIGQSGIMALERLFDQWGVQYKAQEGVPVCRQASTYGLRCLEGIGNLMSLRHLNRPAILKLYDDKSREYYAVLTGLTKSTAFLTVGASNLKVAAEDLESHYSGNYTIFYKAPPAFQNDILPGIKSAAVQWLDKELSLIQGLSKKSGFKERFDDELVNEVKKFQLANGLIPDGIVGAKTIIEINNAINSEEARLTGIIEDK